MTDLSLFITEDYVMQVGPAAHRHLLAEGPQLEGRLGRQDPHIGHQAAETGRRLVHVGSNRRLQPPVQLGGFGSQAGQQGLNSCPHCVTVGGRGITEAEIGLCL
jgi:hypothetical protein